VAISRAEKNIKTQLPRKTPLAVLKASVQFMKFYVADVKRKSSAQYFFRLHPPLLCSAEEFISI